MVQHFLAVELILQDSPSLNQARVLITADAGASEQEYLLGLPEMDGGDCSVLI